jgi:acyl-CoA dehydrogenase
MDFKPTKSMELVGKLAKEISQSFSLEYWREKDEKHEFAEEFWRALCEAGFTGAVIPEEYGGSGMGLLELVSIIENLCRYNAGLAGVWYLMLSEIFVSLPIVRYGTIEQKERYLPKLAIGEYEGCLALTEPVAGTNTLRISTYARREGDEYVINGDKIFISGIDRAEVMVLVTRTTPYEEAPKRTLGITLFLVDLPNDAIEYIPISKHGINYSNTCEVKIKNLRLGEDSILGPPEFGWYVLLDILNPERIGFAIGAVGTAQLAIDNAVEYSRQRRVFEDPIGSYQALQHPISEAYAYLETAKLMTYKAAWVYDNEHKPPSDVKDGDSIMRKAIEYKEVGDITNVAKVVAVESSIKAVYWAMQIYGGYGYARETHVERWWREINLLRLAPVTQQMALNYIAHHILRMPKSYR